MTTLTEAFTGGTAGNNLTTGTTSFSAFGATVPKFSSIVVRAGLSAQFLTAGTNTAKWTGLNWSGTYLREYVSFGTTPTSARATIWSAYKTGTVLQASLEITTAGFLRLRNGGTTVATGTVGIAASTVYRVEWDLVSSTPTQAARLYDAAGNLLDSISGAAPTGNTTEIWLGLIQATDAVYNVDDVTAQDSPLTVVGPTDPTFTESYEGGTAGANFTTSNTTFTAIGSTPPTFSATVVKAGQSGRFHTAGTNTAKWTGVDWATMFCRTWIMFTTMPTTARATIWSAYKTGTVLQASLEINLSGNLQMRTGTGGTTVGTGTKVLLPNTVYRVEWDLKPSTTSQTARLYRADGNILETINATALTGNTTELWNGLIQATDGDYLLDTTSAQSTTLTPITPEVITIWWVDSTPLTPHIIP